MSAPPNTRGVPIEGTRQLVEYLDQGSKPPEDWRIGTEHEKFVFRLDDHRPVPYEGEHGIAALLEAMTRFGWTRVYEGDRLLALSQGRCTITLEPAGQFELSGAPLETIHETCAEVQGHLKQVRKIAGEFGLGMIGLGFEPKWRLEDMPRMPKGRSEIMRRYMPKVGTLGLDMMHRTCTVQVNLDFSSEADMVRKMRVGMALQPLATALFAASPFTEGRPNGFLSYRSHIWTDTDNQRAGILPFVFDPDFGFERYVDWVLDAPMYFVYRDGQYLDAAGQSFRDFMAGKLPALPGEIPHMGDWSDHLTTVFPEVRLKRFIEMRGADGGPWRRLCALPAFWVGLLYDSEALDAAASLIADWTAEEVMGLRNAVPAQGLATPFRGRTLREVALEVLAIARHGLHRRGRRNSIADDESHFLDPLFTIAGSGKTPAEELLRDFHEKWGERIAPIYEEYAY
jgi:glutamate--cysteine ligase